MPCCTDTIAWVWVWVMGIGLVTALLLKHLNPAYSRGGFARVILLGAGGAAVGAASVQVFATFTPSSAVVAVCAWVGSLILLDVNHLMQCHSARRQPPGPR